MMVTDHCKGHSHVSLKSLRWRWWITTKATLMCHCKGYNNGDESLQRLPWRQLKRLLWRVIENAMMTVTNHCKGYLEPVTSPIFTVDFSLYSTVQHLVWYWNFQRASKLGSSRNSNSNPFHYFSNQVNKCMCGNFKSNHAIRSIQIHILGKEGKCEFRGIYQIFPNKLDPQ
jgi:hypothetical protein